LQNGFTLFIGQSVKTGNTNKHSHYMTLHEFDGRMIDEEQKFLKMCLDFGVWDKLEGGRVSPTLALAFAEGLILDLSVEDTRARIHSDPAGAAAVCEVVQARIHDRKTRPLLAADIPREHLTPFYVMSSLVLDVPEQDLQEFERMMSEL
jgi:hypothetical protein